MEILKNILNILHYPAWFGIVFGVFISVFLIFEHYKELKATDGKFGLLHIILLICIVIAVIYFPLKYYVNINNETVYDKLAKYSMNFYDINNADSALNVLAADLKKQLESKEDEFYVSDYDMGFDDGYYNGYDQGYNDAKQGKPNALFENE